MYSCICIVTSPYPLPVFAPFQILYPRSPTREMGCRVRGGGEGNRPSVRRSLFEEILAQTSETRGRSRRLASQLLRKSSGCDLRDRRRDVLRILEGFQVAGLGNRVLFLFFGSGWSRSSDVIDGCVRSMRGVIYFTSFFNRLIQQGGIFFKLF